MKKYILAAAFLLTHVFVFAQSENTWGIVAGAGIGKLRYNVSDTYQYTFNNSVVKCMGLSYEMPLTKVDEHVSFYNELVYRNFKANTLVHIPDTANGGSAKNYYDNDFTFSPHLIELGSFIRYSFTKTDFKYFFGVGMYNSFMIASKNKLVSNYTKDGATTTNTVNAAPSPAFYGIMLQASTGFTYRYFGMELRYDPGRNYSNKFNSSVYMPAFMVLLNIRLAQ